MSQRIISYVGTPNASQQTFGTTIRDGASNILQTTVVPSTSTNSLQVLRSITENTISVSTDDDPPPTVLTFATAGSIAIENSTVMIDAATVQTLLVPIPVNMIVGSAGAMCQLDINTSVLLPADQPTSPNDTPLMLFCHIHGVINFPNAGTVNAANVIICSTIDPQSSSIISISRVSLIASMTGSLPQLNIEYAFGKSGYTTALETATGSDVYTIITDANFTVVPIIAPVP
jgi:hypothetical protein